MEWLAEQPGNPWNDLLQEAVDIYELETADTPLPTSHFIEWLAEWARDNRRRQHGLLLTSAHRAKGLEFDHVAVLDGGWDRRSRNEDRDAPRRLYYVAMTRAKKTLILARCGHSNPYLKLLHGHDSVLTRPVPEQEASPPPGLDRQYLRPALRDVDLSYPARQRQDHQRIKQAISQMTPGDPIQVRTDRTPWEIATPAGLTIGRLARSFTAPQNPGPTTATVLAVATWDKSKSDEKYHRSLHTDAWEVVIPEIIVQPTPDPPQQASPSKSQRSPNHNPAPQSGLHPRAVQASNTCTE